MTFLYINFKLVLFFVVQTMEQMIEYQTMEQMIELSNYGTDDRISASARMSASQSYVTRKKHIILLPLKRMKLTTIFLQT